MALTHHDDINLMIGDEWLIVGKLLDEKGEPLDLMTGVELGWALVGPDGDMLPDLADAVTLETKADGIVHIVVPDFVHETSRACPLHGRDQNVGWR